MPRLAPVAGIEQELAARAVGEAGQFADARAIPNDDMLGGLERASQAVDRGGIGPGEVAAVRRAAEHRGSEAIRPRAAVE